MLRGDHFLNFQLLKQLFYGNKDALVAHIFLCKNMNKQQIIWTIFNVIQEEIRVIIIIIIILIIGIMNVILLKLGVQEETLTAKVPELITL